MAFDLGNFLGGLGGAIDSLSPLLRLGGSYYAGQRSADRMEDAARSYRELGQQAAGMADPWGQNRRTWAQGQLDDLLADPTKSPVYQSMERRAMQALGPRLAAEGRSGSDAGSRDWLETLGDVSNKYTGEWADRFGRWGGADLDPSNAARFLMQGGQLEQDALTAAMAARLAPLGTLTGGQTSGGSQGGLSQLLRSFGNGGGGGPGGFGGQDSGRSPAGIQELLRMYGTSPSSLAGLWSGIPSIPGLQEIYGNIGNGDWSLGGQFVPGWSDAFFNAQQPGYGSWWEGYNPFGDDNWSGEIDFSTDDIWNIFGLGD